MGHTRSLLCLFGARASFWVLPAVSVCLWSQKPRCSVHAVLLSGADSDTIRVLSSALTHSAGCPDHGITSLQTGVFFSSAPPAATDQPAVRFLLVDILPFRRSFWDLTAPESALVFMHRA